MKKIRIAVLIGGTSSERDISLISGKEVANALDRSKYEVKIYDPATDLIKLAEDKDKIDIVFPVLHGPGGEDGTIQGFLELLKLPYVGSKVLASALAMNKEISKKIYRQNDILTPDSRVFTSKDDKEIDDVTIPCVVKPISQGSSMGTSIVRTKDRLKKAIDYAFKFENKIMMEDYVDGIEITAPVLGNEQPTALPLIEIVPPEGKFFDREVKYNGQTQEIVPARLNKDLIKEAQEIAIQAHLVLGCRGLSRTDMIIEKSPIRQAQGGKIYVLETNTMPGMTSESLFPKSAKTAGLNFSKLLDKLIEFAERG